MTPLPLWAEILVGALLLLSGVLALISALGLHRLPNFFSRMHAPAITAALGVWAVALASILYFSLHHGRLELQSWLIILLLAVTAPVTTTLLARAALFRKRTETEPKDRPGTM
ncbi:Na+/H+ antiporter subunit G [Roseateles sp. DAIF2]|uniref:monovalent cation/H(+) antiporter subunit G n=1 Tax=Roseateles sp. DAIF2 TaxID=2714952 RepID=UPI0018A2F400|nr:monovalent cation/H(+) antiporter subunit G [Roseateles sp. DAIF2]QPF73902.1 Na+/H+ antiporter subunit G [Roseateles sp. DAIF2]